MRCRFFRKSVANKNRSNTYVDVIERYILKQYYRKSSVKRKKIRIRPGDIFRIPIRDELYCYGRLSPQEQFAHFWSIATSDDFDINKFRTISRLEFTELIVIDPIMKGTWPIVDHLPWNPGEFVWQHYLVLPNITCAEGPINEFTDVSSKLRPAKKDERAETSKLSIWNEAGVIAILRKRFGIAEPNA